jgi:type II secretory pathway pseudopilin PulG
MRLYPQIQFADAKEERRQGERAFTMVEIAIAIGVIGFALVAVIGVLPTGMNVQKDNREDTTISQDAPFFIDAIRNGGTLTTSNSTFNGILVDHGADFLTNYVESITILGYTNGVVHSNETYTGFANGAEIIGLLSAPEGLYVSLSNYSVTRAVVRSLSSSAVQQNGANLVTTFRYQMDVEVVPFANNVPPDSTNYLLYQTPAFGYAPNSPEVLDRSNRCNEVDRLASPSWAAPWQTNVGGLAGVGSLAYNCFDVRLHFSWPVFPNGAVGPGRQTYRTTIASQILPYPSLVNILGINAQLWFFQPQHYTNYCSLLSQ